MSTNLPYTHIDLSDTRLTVDDGVIGLFSDEGTITTSTPTGPDAVALARAVLAAAGDTGHRVVSEDWLIAEITMERYEAARSMRDRAAIRAEQNHGSATYTAAAIRALPLLPTEEPAPALCAAPCPRHDHTCARSSQHTYPHRDVKQKGDETCTWDDAEVRAAARTPLTADTDA